MRLLQPRGSQSRLAARSAPDGAERRLRRFLAGPGTIARSLAGRFSGRARLRGLEALSVDLRAIREELPAIAGVLGQKFLACAGKLESLSSASSRLVTESEALVHLATGQGDGHATVSETVQVLEPALGFLDGWSGVMTNQLAAIEDSRQRVRRLLTTEAGLESAVASLRHVPILFRMEAARLPDAAREGFASLTDEIASIHYQVRDIFSEQFQTLRRARSTLESVGGCIGNQSAEVSAAVESGKRKAQQSLRKVAGEISQNGRREVRLTSAGSTIAEQIAGIVMGLQAHDIASQQFEHIGAALAETEHSLNDARLRSSRSAAMESLCSARGAVEIQIGQAKSACAQLERTGEELSAAARTVVNQVESLDSECLGLNEFKEVTVAADGAIQVLLDLMADMRRLLESAAALARESRDLISPVREAAGRLTGSIDGLSARMRLAAWNARIKAIHIGFQKDASGGSASANGLETLAAHTADISSDITARGAVIAADLVALVAALEEIDASFAALAEKGAEQIAFLSSQGAAHERDLHQLRDETLGRLTVVGKTADEIQETCLFIEQQTATRASATEPLLALIERLSAVAARLKELSPDLSIAKLESGLERAGYTMSSERKTHRSVVHALREEADDTPRAAGPERSSASDTFDSGVELF